MIIGPMAPPGSHSYGKTAGNSGDNYFLSFFSLTLTTCCSFFLLFSQLPSLMTLWSAAEESVWPSRWPKTASTGAVTAQPLASWRWTSLNCCETANMRWGKQVSNTGEKCQLIGEEKKVLMCVFARVGVSPLVNMRLRVESETNTEKVINVMRCGVQSAIAPAKRVSHFEISKSGISIQTYCLVFTLSLTLFPEVHTDKSVWFNNILVKQKQTNYWK